MTTTKVTSSTSAGLVIEVSSVPVGYLLLDQCIKAASIHILEASCLPPSKFFIFLKGSLVEVQKAHDLAMQSFKEHILDSTVLSNLEDSILEALYGLSKVEANPKGIVVVETTSLSSMLLGLHVALAKKSISVIEVKSGRGLGGRSTAFFTGEATPLKEAMEVFIDTVKPKGFLSDAKLILDPHPDFLSFYNISGAN